MEEEQYVKIIPTSFRNKFNKKETSYGFRVICCFENGELITVEASDSSLNDVSTEHKKLVKQVFQTENAFIQDLLHFATYVELPFIIDKTRYTSSQILEMLKQ